MMSKAVRKISGQSLIEMVIALGIASFIIIALMQSLITSAKNSRFAKNQTLATRYSQEGIELIRNQRDSLGWSGFYNTYPITSLNWCLTGNVVADWGISLPCSVITGTIFTRQADFILNSSDEIGVKVTASWDDNGVAHKSEQNTVLTRWQ